MDKVNDWIRLCCHNMPPSPSLDSRISNTQAVKAPARWTRCAVLVQVVLNDTSKPNSNVVLLGSLNNVEIIVTLGWFANCGCMCLPFRACLHKSIDATPRHLDYLSVYMWAEFRTIQPICTSGKLIHSCIPAFFSLLRACACLHV